MRTEMRTSTHPPNACDTACNMPAMRGNGRNERTDGRTHPLRSRTADSVTRAGGYDDFGCFRWLRFARRLVFVAVLALMLAGCGPADATDVHPGAYCTPHGAHGTTAGGTAMVCTDSPTDRHDRWRNA